jgi:hypothetical protein
MLQVSIMRTKWFGRFWAFIGLIFLGAMSYLLTRNGPDLSKDSHQASDSNPLSSNASITNEAGKESDSARAGESMNRRARESADRADSSRDFSGVTTMDPGLPTPATTPTPEPKPKSTAPLPLVFQPVDPGYMKITPEQQQVIDDLQQGFLDEVGGADQDPNDPQYRQRWAQVRPLFDQRLKTQLGQQFFLQYQIAAGQQAAKQK